MTADRWKKIEWLYEASINLPPEQRARFLAESGADPDMRREVESLLAQRENVPSFLEQRGLDVVAGLVTRKEPGTLVGRTIDHYEVRAFVGAGGMGEVYRARDSRLGRDVALKVLPAEFSDDPKRMRRSECEAKLLACLNHPNIAAIYDLEESDGIRCLILEFVEGQTLAERVKRGLVPITEALEISRQIAEALEAAHEQGIVHRDLKPGNVMISAAGRIKVLDFGIAKMLEPQANADAPIDSASVGVVQGTPSYMSPEQARGKPVDKRTDIWAFGCVLYELLTGHQAFRRETVTDTLAAVVDRDPDWDRLPAKTPWLIQRLLRRTLTKDGRQRLGDIRDARIEIEEVLAGSTVMPDVTVTAGSKRRDWLAWAMALALASGLAFVSVLYLNRTAASEIRAEVSTPYPTDPFSFAISPDGHKLVFSALNEGKPQLWVRPLDSIAAQPLAGTEGADSPFWSPDSESVGFFADGKLKRIGIVGGTPQVLANASAGRGGAWNKEGTILFTPTGSSPIFKVAATGGEPGAVTRLEAELPSSHRFPQFLPDGRHFIYLVQGGRTPGVYASSLDGGSSKWLVSAEAAVTSPLGFLLFVQQTTLFAQAFDFSRQELSGNPFPVAERVASDATARGAVGLSVSAAHVAYRTRFASVAGQLTWLDRSGNNVGAIGRPDSALLTDVELSPDGKHVAVYRTVNGNTDVWLIDKKEGVPKRFTFDAAIDFKPLWSSNGNRVAFQSNRNGIFNLYWKLSNGAGTDELLLETDQSKVPQDWSPDGRFLLFRSLDPKTGMDLWILPMSGDKKPFPFQKTPFEEREGQFSPDGKWIAYQSNELGQFEIFVRPFLGSGGTFQISADGGTQPRWNKNGKEIFYVSLDGKLVAAPVRLSTDGQSLQTATPAPLFPVRIAGGPVPGVNKQQYAVSADGQRFLVNLALDEGPAPPITLILNWKPKP